MNVTGWETSQRQTPCGAVESEQRVVIATPVVAFDRTGAAALGSRYWGEVERATLGLVRARRNGEGVELRVFGRWPVLLSFGPQEIEVTPHSIRCRIPINGGLLAERPAGELSLAQLDGDRLELRSAIHGFYPALAAREGRPHWTGALYGLVQSRIHIAISRRYFARLAIRQSA